MKFHIRKWLKRAIVWEKNLKKKEIFTSQLMKQYGW